MRHARRPSKNPSQVSLGSPKHKSISVVSLVYVEYDPEKVKLGDLEKAVTDAGYGTVNEKIILRIGGMTCAVCEKTVTEALKHLEGVLEVTVNLATEKALVVYNPRMVTRVDMKKAVEDAGYQYLGVEGEEDLAAVAREKDLRSKRIRIVVGFAVGLPLMALMYIPLSLPLPLAYP